MAKYDTYVLAVKVGDDKASADLKLTILFEDGDNASAVISTAREVIEIEAIAMKESEFLKNIEP